MTTSEFITESLSFEPGRIVVVSGPNLEMLFQLLLSARDAIIAAGSSSAVVVDSRAVLRYPSDAEERAVLFEHVAISSPGVVVLVPNQFDRLDLRKNMTQKTLEIDVVYDLYTNRAVSTIPEAASQNYVTARNLFAFMSRVYYYDTRTGDVAFVKTQNPDR